MSLILTRKLKLYEAVSFVFISMGDLVRHEIQIRNATRGERKRKRITDHEMYGSLLNQWMMSVDLRRGLIVDISPQTKQFYSLFKFTASLNGLKDIHILHLKTPRKIAWQRW